MTTAETPDASWEGLSSSLSSSFSSSLFHKLQSAHGTYVKCTNSAEQVCQKAVTLSDFTAGDF